MSDFSVHENCGFIETSLCCSSHPSPFKVLIVNDNTVFLDICIYITYVLKFFKFVEKVF